eukprot:1907577-Prymnesium_polylepis.1
MVCVAQKVSYFRLNRPTRVGRLGAPAAAARASMAARRRWIPARCEKSAFRVLRSARGLRYTNS